MVEGADLLGDLSNNSSLFNQSEFLQRSMVRANASFEKMLPNSSQMKEDDDPDKLPCFGDPLNESEIKADKDDLELEVERLIKGSAPAKSGGVNDDSFSNLQPAEDLLVGSPESNSEKTTPVIPADMKESMIKHSDDSNFF